MPDNKLKHVEIEWAEFINGNCGQTTHIYSSIEKLRQSIVEGLGSDILKGFSIAQFNREIDGEIHGEIGSGCNTESFDALLEKSIPFDDRLAERINSLIGGADVDWSNH